MAVVEDELILSRGDERGLGGYPCCCAERLELGPALLDGSDCTSGNVLHANIKEPSRMSSIGSREAEELSYKIWNNEYRLGTLNAREVHLNMVSEQ